MLCSTLLMMVLPPGEPGRLLVLSEADDAGWTAALEGAPSCNGWTYWHFRREGKMIPIDILRQHILAEVDDVRLQVVVESERLVGHRGLATPGVRFS